MAVGDGSLIGGLGYLAIGRQTATSTYNTCTANLDFLSFSMKTVQSGKILEQIEGRRTYSKRIQTGKVVQGDCEFYFAPRLDACNYILHQAFGSIPISATVTSETIGSSAMDHTLLVGGMDNSWPSLCMNVRKGESTGGKVFEYTGVRVNELTFSAEIDEPLKVSASFIALDSTQSSNDVESALSVSSADIMDFTQGRFSVENTFASLTASSFWHVQSFEYKMSNNLKADSTSRRIGSDLLEVLPPGMLSQELKCVIRFDTTTAYDAMLAESKLSLQFEFLGNTLSGSVAREGIKFSFPSVYIDDAGDPEISGPDEILTSEVVFHVLRDDTSDTGYAVQCIVTNTTTSYN